MDLMNRLKITVCQLFNESYDKKELLLVFLNSYYYFTRFEILVVVILFTIDISLNSSEEILSNINWLPVALTSLSSSLFEDVNSPV